MAPSPQCGVGVSRRPDGAAAAGEAVGRAIEATRGGVPQLVILFATASHADPRPVVKAAEEAARGAPVVGGAASGVLTIQGEIEEGPAVAAMAIAAAEGPDEVRAIPLDPAGAGMLADGGVVRGLAAIVADGYSQHPERTAAVVRQSLGGAVSVVGALAVGSRGVFPAFRWQAGTIAASGVSGACLVSRGEPIVVTAAGCRPVGPIYTVTEARGNVIVTLDGRRAFDAFAERARPLLGDLRRAAQSIFVAVPAGAPLAGDPIEDAFVIRGLLQFEPDAGLLAVSEPIPTGARIRFAIREAYGAREHLRRAAGDACRRLEGRPPRLGLYFNCAGRGRALYGVEDHDVSFIRSALGDFPLLGMFGGGELAPLGGATRLLLFSGVLALIP